ncbi:MAG: DUF5916 domain-containing protein [Myxococcota bacterium]
MTRSAPWARGALFVLGSSLAASAGASERPRARGIVVETEPLIDGRLDDLVWRKAPRIGGFVERSPQLRKKPPVDTRVAFLFTKDALIVGVWLDGIEVPIGRSQRRDDGAIFRDDAISIKLDPGNDGRTTYGFVLNPRGARLDYRGIDESDFRTEYDSVWLGDAHVNGTNWTAEFRIPWASLGIDPTAPPPSIGLNFSRDHARLTATYDWALMTPPLSPIAASRYGRLEGLAPLVEVAEDSASATLQVLPYAVTGFRRVPQAGTDNLEAESLLDAGIDAKARIGRVRAHLTVNTDFAQADLDNQVVNLTRFGLFLPEKRDFFLEDLEVFSFGQPQEAQLLFTRRIGLAPGTANLEAIPILAGAKVVGRPVDQLRIGLLQATTQPLDGTPWTSHGVVRNLVELGGGSNVGVMATHRQSLEDEDDRNITFGGDGAFRAQDTNLVVRAFGMGTVTGANAPDPTIAAGGDGRGGFANRVAPGGGLEVTLREQFIRPTLNYRAFHPEFRGDLGFFRRVGVHSGEASLELEPRLDHGGINRFNTGVSARLVGAWQGDALLDYGQTWFGQVRTTEGYVAGTRISRDFERVQQPFTVGRRTTITPDEYRMWIATLFANSPSTYVISGDIELIGRDYYGGRLLEANVNTSWAPSSLLRFDLGGIYDRVTFGDLPDFSSLVINGRTNFGFRPDLGLRIFTGYNLLGDVLQLQSRLRWSYTPAADMFVIVQTDLDDDAWRPLFSSILVKSTFRWPDR